MTSRRFFFPVEKIAMAEGVGWTDIACFAYGLRGMGLDWHSGVWKYHVTDRIEVGFDLSAKALS